MNMPRFTADASLYRSSRHYWFAAGGSCLTNGNTTVTLQECGWFEGSKLSPALLNPHPIPPFTPTFMDKIPPKKIGDLSCPAVDDAARAACRETCESHPDTPCALLCTYRKDDNGKCVLWVECTSACDEIPGQILSPTG
jgi:hypothetical protein